jgi:hypothetical protein
MVGEILYKYFRSMLDLQFWQGLLENGRAGFGDLAAPFFINSGGQLATPEPRKLIIRHNQFPGARSKDL